LIFQNLYLYTRRKKKLVPIYRALQSKCFEAAIDEYTLVNIMDEASSFDDTHLVAFWYAWDDDQYDNNTYYGFLLSLKKNEFVSFFEDIRYQIIKLQKEKKIIFLKNLKKNYCGIYVMFISWKNMS